MVSDIILYDNEVNGTFLLSLGKLMYSNRAAQAAIPAKIKHLSLWLCFIDCIV